MMQQLPNDPMLCLSVVNTKLRDRYASLSKLCEDLAMDEYALVEKLRDIDYVYDEEQNQFV